MVTIAGVEIGTHVGSRDWSEYRTERCYCATGDDGKRGYHTHRMHIPVGMPDDTFARALRDGRLAAVESHARWAARRVVRRLITEQRIAKARFATTISRAQSLATLELEPLIVGWLRQYNVPKPAIRMAYVEALRLGKEKL